MLSGVPASISPELLKVLHEMGHGDTLVIGDANFPGCIHCGKRRIILISGATGTGPQTCWTPFCS